MMDRHTMRDENVVKEADAVLTTVLVQRGNITIESIKAVVDQFNPVYKFTKMEKREVIGKLIARFIPTEF